jgi:hypothetical protein
MSAPGARHRTVTNVPRKEVLPRRLDAVTVCVDPSLHAVNAPTTIGTTR